MTPPTARSIAGFGASVTSLDVGDDRVCFVSVADLERHVDRDALLRADDPPEPPYWAHCWSGAREPRVERGAVPGGVVRARV